MYSKEFQSRAHELLKTKMPMMDIAMELGCSQTTIYRFNKLLKVREGRPSYGKGIRAKGLMFELLTALEKRYGKIQAQAFHTDVEETTLVRLRRGAALPNMKTFLKLVEAADLKVKLIPKENP